MNEGIEPAAQTEGGTEASTGLAIAPAGASPPQALGIVRTFAWIAAAVVAGLLSASLFMLALIASERLWALPIDAYEIAIVWSAAAIAELLFFVVIVIACRRSGWRATDYLGLVHPTGRYVRWTLLALCLSTAVTIAAGQLGPFGDDSLDDPILLKGTVVWFLALTVVAPVGEELLFRGFLYRAIAASRLGIVGAIILTSLLWSGVHYERTLLGFAEIAFGGLALGWLRWRSGSTVPTIAIHGLHNIASALTWLFR